MEIPVQAYPETQVALAVQAQLAVEVELQPKEQVQAAPSAG